MSRGRVAVIPIIATGLMLMAVFAGCSGSGSTKKTTEPATPAARAPVPASTGQSSQAASRPELLLFTSPG